METIIMTGPTWRRYRIQLGMISRIVISLVVVFAAGFYAWYARSNSFFTDPVSLAAVGSCALIVVAVMSYHSSAFVDGEAGFISIMSGFGPFVVRWKFDLANVTAVCLYDAQAAQMANQSRQLLSTPVPAMGFRHSGSAVPRYLIDNKPKSELRVAARELGHLINKPVEIPDWAED
jgi:hypothetical protein